MVPLSLPVLFAVASWLHLFLRSLRNAIEEWRKHLLKDSEAGVDWIGIFVAAGSSLAEERICLESVLAGFLDLEEVVGMLLGDLALLTEVEVRADRALVSNTSEWVLLAAVASNSDMDTYTTFLSLFLLGHLSRFFLLSELGSDCI